MQTAEELRCVYYSNPTLFNCTISGNSAQTGGGVRCEDYSNPTLFNCTISGNSANVRGGGLFCFSNSSPRLTNCILWGDLPQEIDVSQIIEPIITYCDVQGGWDGEGNIDADPQFAFDADFHLMAHSPCIDAGTNTPPGGLPTDDYDGNPRPLDGDGDTVTIADMGMFEFNPAAPSIALNPEVFVFSAHVDGDNPPNQTLVLVNCGGGVLDWEVAGQPAWLTVSPSNGESKGEVDQATLSVDASGLPHGIYTAVLEVIDEQAVNSPRNVAVTLYVSATFHVPSEYSTIQTAIDATAVPGDVVEIADGTYIGTGNKDLDFAGKAITVLGVSGDPLLCVIDCEGDGRGFFFHSSEGSDSIIQGLTIANGYAADGGAVYCSDSSPTLVNCTISGNSVSQAGGGFYCSFSSPTLTNCTVNGNSASQAGGGVYCSNSSPALVNCTISGNSVSHDGGGFYCYSSNLTLTNCTISGNSAGDVSGGIYCYYGYQKLRNCTISENSANSTGGGVYCYHSYPTLINCTISGNSAYSYGGGVCCLNGSNPTLANCTISGNSASNSGGVHCSSSSPTLTNSTISGNSASYGGGGVYCTSDDSSPTLTNCILWGDIPQEIHVNSGTPVVTYSNVQNGADKPWFGEGCIDADPLFVDSDGPDDDPNTWEDNDYRLAPTSPCIDAGDNSAVPNDGFDLDDDGDTDEPTPFDLDGNARFVDDLTVADTGVGDPDHPDLPIVDMGAYEFTPGDLDRDGDVDLSDLAVLLGRYGSCVGDPIYHLAADFDASGCIDLPDLAYLLGYYGSGM